MKGTFAASILALIVVGCKAGPASSTDPFFGATRIPPPATGSAQPIPPGSGYYQNSAGSSSSAPMVPPGNTLPTSPQGSPSSNSYIQLPGNQSYPSSSTPNQSYPAQVYPTTPQSVPPATYSPTGGGSFRRSSSADPFPSADASMTPVRRAGDVYSRETDNPRASSDSSIAQTTALGSRGSRVVVPERALVWQETPRNERSTFSAETSPASPSSGSLPVSGSPLASRPETAFEASDRPLSERERITRTLGPAGRMVPNGQAAVATPNPAIGSSRAAISSDATPGYLPRNRQVIDIMDLPPAKKRNDPNVRPTSAVSPLSGSSNKGGAKSGIYFRDNTNPVGTSRQTTHTTTAQRPNGSTTGIFHGTLNYSEPHRRWCVELDPSPDAGNAVDARKILLADDVLLSGLERGNYVKLEGRIEDPGNATDGLPVVKTLKVLDFRGS